MQKKLINNLPSISIVIPAFNEEENLKWVVENILSDAPLYLNEFEIIIVDDGSKDNTGKIADALGKKDKRIYVIHQINKGYAEAMLAGIKEAKKEFVAYLPADGQFLLKDMQFCLPYMNEADLILGARGSRADYTLYRLILSYTYLILLKMFFNINFQDVNWLNIWKTKEIKNLKISSRGIFLLAEIVIRFQKKGLRVIEAPSFYRPRRGGQAKNAKLSIAFKTFMDTLKFWFTFKLLNIYN